LQIDPADRFTQGSVAEAIISTRSGKPGVPVAEGVELRMFASEQCGATGFSTGIATFKPNTCMPYHFHEFSEAVTVLEGRARLLLEGRSYELGPLDCVHVPAGVAHQMENEDKDVVLATLSAFASASPTRTRDNRNFPIEERRSGQPVEGDPETIVWYQRAGTYELAENAFFCDLFARRFGANGICGGYGRFLPGASLPCHMHDFDESITIVRGLAVCLARGRKYELSGYDTAFIPRGTPHRFLNESDHEMAMIWVYAGDEPDRRIVRSEYCSGEFVWPGGSSRDSESS
jgi:quercetin dioxygenase-like cupin family protein